MIRRCLSGCLKSKRYTPRRVFQPPWTLLRSDESAMGRKALRGLLENALVDE